MKRIILIITALAIMKPAIVIADDAEIARLYEENGVKGTLVIASLNSTTKYVHNSDRAERRFLPASTFKIANTLIALEESVIQDNKEVIKWDGVDRVWPSWNKNQTLSTAFSSSCVWCYQKFAQIIGDDLYVKYLNEFDYGNKKTGKQVTTFWLEGDLGISAEEQIVFLRKVHLENLPIKSENIQLLKNIMLVEETPMYSLSAKTGWTNRIEPQLGWYVGYIEVEGKVWLFANNMQIRSKSDLILRKQLVIAALKLKKII